MDKARDCKPLVSVAVITYNGEQYIRQQLDSVLGQSYENLDIVISDDASTDTTPTIAREYSVDSRVRYIENQSNVGIRENLNRVIPNLRGDYIAICDQDDIWDCKKIELLMNKISGFSAAYADSELIDADGCVIGKSLLQSLKIKHPNIGRNYLSLAYKNSVSGHAALYDARIIRGALPLKKSPIYDQQLAIRAACDKGIVFLSRPLVQHRQHGNNNYNNLIESQRAARQGRSARYKVEILKENLEYVVAALRNRAGLTLGDRLLLKLISPVIKRLERAGQGQFQFILYTQLVILGPKLFRLSKKPNIFSLAIKYCK